MNAPEERLWHLERFDLLQVLGPEEMAEFNTRLKEASHEKGASIYLPGDPSDAVYFLKKGRVKVSYLDENGKRLTLAIYGKGEPFGEMSIIGQEDRKLEASALEEVWLCWIGRDELLRFAEEHPRLSLRIAKLIGWRRQEIENQMEDLLFKDVPTRLARLLWKLGGSYGRNREETIQIGPRFTHQDLAELIGSTRETTSLMLGRFVKEGLIGRGWGRIIIKNKTQLRQRARL